MSIENCRELAALIAAHPGQKVVGRTRLQKEVKLLQRCGFPTDYSYMIHFYGPYSEELQSDIGLLDAFGLVDETAHMSQDNNPYYTLQVTDSTDLPKVDEFQSQIDLLESVDAIVLELAATYDAFREAGSDHDEAIMRLHRKKGSKCNDGNEDKALELLRQLDLDIE